MDFSEAAQRFLELKLMLENRQISMEEFDHQAGNLRVLGPDNAWWQIRASDGVWFRWDGQTWEQATPPESSFDWPTGLAFKVKSELLEQEPGHREEAEQSPQQVVVNHAAADLSAPVRPRGTVRILRGQPALDLLLEELMIREIYTASGKRYQIVNPRPIGVVQGIAFRISNDGYLDPDVAVEALFTGGGFDSLKSQIPAHGFAAAEGYLNNREVAAQVLNPQAPANQADQRDPIQAVSAYAPPSPRFQAAIDQLIDSISKYLPNEFEIQMARQIAVSLGGAFERDLRHLEIPALGPLAGEALAWWHSIFNSQLGFPQTLVNDCVIPISQRFILLADQPPLYLATSRLLKEFKSLITQPASNSELPLSAVFPLILSNPSGLEDLSTTTITRLESQSGDPASINEGQASNDVETLLRNAAYNRLKNSMEISKGLYNTAQGQLTVLSGAQKIVILQEIRDNAFKTIEQFSHGGDSYLISMSHLQLATANFDLAARQDENISEFQRHITTGLSICADQAGTARRSVLWLNTQFIPWALVLLSNAALYLQHENAGKLHIAIESAANELEKTYDRQRQLRETAIKRLFMGRAVLSIIQQMANLQHKVALKSYGAETLEIALGDFLYAGDLHLANECRQMIKALS